MRVEFQVTGTALAAGVTDRFKSQPLCAAGIYESMVVDHVEVLDATVVKLPVFGHVHFGPLGPAMISPAYDVAVSQELKLVIASLAALESAGSVPVADTLEATIAIRIAFTASITAGKPTFSFGYAGVDLGSVLGSLPNANDIAASIGAAAQSVSAGSPTTLDTTPISDLVGHPVTVSNVGVATDDAGSLITVRIELDAPGPSTIADWSAFYATDPTSWLVPGNDWCQFIDQHTVVQAIVDRIEDGLYTAAQQGTFDSPGDPSAVWHPAWPGVHVGFAGEVIDACPAWVGLLYVGMVDVDVAVTLDATFSVPATNSLAMHLKFYWETTDAGETFGCAVSAAVFWPAVGTILMAQGKINEEFSIGLIAEVAVPFLGAQGVFAGFLVGVGQATPDLPIEGFEQVADTDADLEYAQTVEGLHLGPGLDVTTVYGVSQGLVLAGTRAVPAQVKHPPGLELSPEQPVFEWGWPDLCQEAVLKATAEVACLNPDPSGVHTALEICDATAVDDGFDQFRPYIKITRSPEGGTVRVAVPISALLPDFLAAPYDCKLLIQTNGGSRLLTIPWFDKPLTVEQQAELQIKIALEKTVKCKLWAHFFWGKHFNPKWHDDPPWRQENERHVWRVVLAGTTSPGDVRLEDDGGRLLASAHLGRADHAELTSLFDAPGRDATVQIAGEPSSGTHSGERPAGSLAVHQTLLLQDAVLGLAQPLAHMSGGRNAAQPALFCVVEGGLRVFDLTQRSFPRLLAHVPGLDLSGFLPRNRVGWGRRGLVWIRDGREGWSVEPVPGEDAPVHAVARYRGSLYCLHDERLKILDIALRPVGSIDLEGFTQLLVVGTTLIASRRGLARTFDIGVSHEPRELGLYELPGAEKLSDPHLAGEASNAVFASGTAAGGVIWSLTGDEPIELASYEADPWFVDTTKVGASLARADRDGRNVALLHVERSMPLSAGEIDPTRRPD